LQGRKKGNFNPVLHSGKKKQERCTQPSPNYQRRFPQPKGTIYSAQLVSTRLGCNSCTIIASTIATANYPTETPQLRSHSLS
jgi:hypothetical protein